ncbi:DUF3857 domain-containing protein [Flavihumibacter fluvii]|uniref:DUF3857 domain-containing protein n=1 Tax=Flavihumibacter fluvii TaxID=2838157 RepID=UPI001BDEB39A|nr:DUF3857 domain-containing protein [Flavihumibacter fluvii]ULQ53712.1 DUF3857 and transglutaminase domain-containing protein [Flavihumibacter fluvii]
MNKIVRLTIALHLLMANLSLIAQDKPDYKFGKVNGADFSVFPPASDPDAHAIIIGDVGKSTVLPNSKGGFGYQFNRRMRVKIVDIQGVSAGKFVIPMYLQKGSSAEEGITSLKAVTYNLEGGKVVETRLAGDQVFTEKINTYYSLKKFSLPALKEGSIFEINYTIESDFLYDFRPWVFQHDYPCLWSEYTTDVPEYFDYNHLVKGSIPFTIETKKADARSYNVQLDVGSIEMNNRGTVSTVVNINRWAIANVPALRKEKYTTSIENYRSEIEFQLAMISFPNQRPRIITPKWSEVAKSLLEDEEFGAQLSGKNEWLDDYLKGIVGSSQEPLEKAKKIYTYVRDNIRCEPRSSIYTTSTFKNLLKSKTGSVADLNLLLVAVLKHIKIDCSPVILSTRDNGFTNPMYPDLYRYNYVICQALIGEKVYLLDASVPDLSFGKLPANCYNGEGRVINSVASPIILSADSIVDKSMSMAILIPAGNEIKGKVSASSGYIGSLEQRNLIRDNGLKSFNDEIINAYGPDLDITNIAIDTSEAHDAPIKLNYDIAYKINSEDNIYITPVFTPFYKQNPFAADTRKFPVEMPYREDRTFILHMGIPAGYLVDDLPKPAKVILNDKDGVFEYQLSVEGENIQLRTRLVLSKANFQPEDYEGLRDFFGYVIKKQSEQIVLKKK